MILIANTLAIALTSKLCPLANEIHIAVRQIPQNELPHSICAASHCAAITNHVISAVDITEDF